MTDPTYPLFPVMAFLGFVVSLIPLPWHLQAWNAGTCAFMLWTAAVCLVGFVNGVVWHGNVNNVAPIWCDISTQIMLANSIGTPASILCITRRLYKITSIQTVSMTRKDKRNDILIDLAIAVGIPILVLLLHIIVHPHRFDILEDIGCYPVTYNTLPSYFLYYSWPIGLGLVSFVYSALTLRAFVQRRAQFASFMSTTTSAINMQRYMRLMLLCVFDMSLTVPLAIYVMYIGTNGIPLSPWISWDDTHFDWLRVGIIPALIWRGNSGYNITVELSRWLTVFCAFFFFAMFGFAAEAKKHYKLAFTWTAKRVGLTRFAPKKPALPTWTRPSPPKFVPSSAFSSKTMDIAGTFDSTSTLPIPARKFSCPKDADYEIPLSPTTYKVVREWEQEQESARRSPTTTLPLYQTEADMSTTEGSMYHISEDDHEDAEFEHIEIGDSRSSTPTPSPFVDDFPRPPPHGVARPYSQFPPAGLAPPQRELRHAASAPVVVVTVETQVRRI